MSPKLRSRHAPNLLPVLIAGLSLACVQDPSPAPHRSSPIAVRSFEPLFESKRSTSLASEEIHRFDLWVDAGQIIRGTLIQEGIDLKVEIAPTSAASGSVFDSPIDRHGPVTFCLVADQASTYSIKIRPWDRLASGDYRLVLQTPRRATAEDHACALATQELGALEIWRSQNSPDSAEILERYRQAIELLEQAGLDYPLAACLAQAGRFEASRGGLENARHAFERAHDLFRSLGDLRQQVSVANWLGRILGRLGELSSARRALKEARDLAREIGDQRGLASALNNLGLLLQGQGQQLAAIQHFEEALGIAVASEDRGEQITFLLNLGISEARLADFERARITLEKARTLSTFGPRTRSFILREIESEIELAWVLHLAGDSARAFGLLTHALEQSRSIEHPMSEAIARDRLATVLRDQESYGASLLNYRASQRLVESHGDAQDRASTQANIGWLFAYWQRPAEARVQLGQAFEAFLQLGDRPGQAHALAGLAVASRRLGQPEQALEQLKEALELVESLHVERGRWGDRYRSIPVWQQYRELQVDLLIELHQKRPTAGFDAQAFLVSDRTRARGLFEMLQESLIELNSTPSPLKEQEEDAKARLLALEDRLLSLRIRQAPPETVADMVERIAEQARAVERIGRSARLTRNDFESLRRPHGMSPREVQALLDSETTLLSFELGEENSFLFALTRNRLNVYTLPPRSVIEGAALAFWRSSIIQRGPRARSQAIRVAQRLSEMLLGPATETLEGRRLIIIGDGVLHYLPFAALPDPHRQDGSPMIDRFELVHVPSAEVIGLLRNRRANRPSTWQRIAIFADPVFATRLPSRASNRQPPDLAAATVPAPLPYSRAEAESIRDKVSPEEIFLALGSEASIETLKRTEGQGYRILHLATHGLVNEANPGLSGILLSMIDSMGQPIDGFLSLSEIYDLDLPTDLIVLSACRTALGQHVRGIGLIGLTRGFFYAGASRLVVSLWDVDDEATASLMDHFYEALLVEGMRPSAALRKAQLQVRAETRWKAPYFWAGFVLQGDFAPLP